MSQKTEAGPKASKRYRLTDPNWAEERTSEAFSQEFVADLATMAWFIAYRVRYHRTRKSRVLWNACWSNPTINKPEMEHFGAILHMLTQLHILKFHRHDDQYHWQRGIDPARQYWALEENLDQITWLMAAVRKYHPRFQPYVAKRPKRKLCTRVQ